MIQLSCVIDKKTEVRESKLCPQGHTELGLDSCLPVASSFLLGKNSPQISPHSKWEAKLYPFTEGKLTGGSV